MKGKCCNVPYFKTKVLKYQGEDVIRMVVAANDELKADDKVRITWQYDGECVKHFQEFLVPKHELHPPSSSVLIAAVKYLKEHKDQSFVPDWF